MDVDRFINELNLERFRRLADAVTTTAERKVLLELLAEEKTKFVERQRTVGSTRTASFSAGRPAAPAEKSRP
jgi:hypothetical protein